MTDSEPPGSPSLPGIKEEFGLLPLRDVVVFPHVVITLYVGRPFSIKSLQYAQKHDNRILLVAQRNSDVEVPMIEDIYRIGCLSTILDARPLEDGTYKLLVEGRSRAQVENVEFRRGAALLCRAEPIDVVEVDSKATETALCRKLLSQFEAYAKSQNKIPGDLAGQLANIEELGRLTDSIASHLPLTVASHQEFLECADVGKRAGMLLERIGQEQEISKIEKKIHGQVKKQIEKSHREFYLNEQVKAIQKELGDDTKNEIDEFKARIEKSGMPEKTREKCDQEVKKLSMMPMMSAEATVVRTYLDMLLSLPWQKQSRPNADLRKAQRRLDHDHYGLEKVKERILEYLAVQRRAKNPKSPVLCFVGPPGVGKTSLGRSIAKATGRRFVRVSLGGVRDEAEIRGHRRTYIGSLPGKIMQGMARVGTRNPVFLFDEIDKMGIDFRGDPAAALLEVLDPEQNHNFADHYIEVGFDLSDALFITTSNTLNIPPALADRLEILMLSGYTESEKMEIARRHLIPKQLKQNGLNADDLEISNPALLSAVRYHTREAGVRELERSVSKICRKVVMHLETENDRKNRESGEERKPAGKEEAEDGQTEADAHFVEPEEDDDLYDDAVLDQLEEDAPSLPAALAKLPADRRVVIGEKEAESLLGVRKYKFGIANEDDKVGQVTGLAWTQLGGELLSIEVSKFKGTGKIVRTGKLGDVMKESIEAAVSVVRSRAKVLGVPETFYRNTDLHVHLPEGAIPKDGPSAGIGIVTALVSVLTGIPARADTAMTGEITLRGEVLQIGGLKSKLLAGHRGGIKRVILPQDNKKDMEEIPEEIKEGLEFHWVRWIDEVLNIALREIPQQKRSAPRRTGKKRAIAPPPKQQAEDDPGRDEPLTH